MMYKKIVLLFMLLSTIYSQTYYGWDGDNFYAANMVYTLEGNNTYVIIDTSTYIFDYAPRTAYGWSHNLTFTSSDLNTVAWTLGTIKFADGGEFSIVAGNTGNMTAPTWVFLDEDVSSTVLQTTTTAGSAVGGHRVMVAVCEDSPAAGGTDAIFQVFGGVGTGVSVYADNVVTNQLTGNHLITNTLTTREILFGSLDPDSLITSINASGATLFITADVINAVSSSDAGRRIEINPTTDRITFYNATQEILSIGDDVLGTVDGITIDSGMVYISTKDNTAVSNLHVEKYAQSMSTVQGIQTLYLSNDAVANVTISPTDSWIVSKIEGERNNANKTLYGIWGNINNSGIGAAALAKGIDLDVDANEGYAAGAYLRANSVSGKAQGIYSYGSSINDDSYGVYGYGYLGNVAYGIYGKATSATTNWAGYFEDGNVKIENALDVDGNADIAGTLNVVGTLDSPTLNTGQGDNELYDMNQNVLTSSSPTFASMNTGQGAYELYYMNQNVGTTSGPAFTGLTVSGTSIVLGTGTAVDQTLYFDNSGESLKWQNSTGRFLLSAPLVVDLPTRDFEFIDSDVIGGTEDGWIGVELQGTLRYIRVYTAK